MIVGRGGHLIDQLRAVARDESGVERSCDQCGKPVPVNAISPSDCFCSAECHDAFVIDDDGAQRAAPFTQAMVERVARECARFACMERPKRWEDRPDWEKGYFLNLAQTSLEASGIAGLTEALTGLPDLLMDAGRALRVPGGRLDIAIALEMWAGSIRDTLAKHGGQQ